MCLGWDITERLACLGENQGRRRLELRHKNGCPSNTTSERRLVFYVPICLQSTVSGRGREDGERRKEQEEEEGEKGKEINIPETVLSNKPNGKTLQPAPRHS